jgi:hypothetical protein
MNTSNDKFLIWSIEHKAWWMPNRHGYTQIKENAGRYSFNEALDIVEEGNMAPECVNFPHEAMVWENPTIVKKL